MPALVAGVSLLTDYILTVAVSVAAGTAALASAFPAFVPFEVPIAVAFVARSSRMMNLRGVKESGKVFAVPTYFFLVNMAVLLGVGVSRIAHRQPAASTRITAGQLPFGDKGSRPAPRRVDVPRAARVRVGRRRGHRCGGDLRRRARVQGSRRGATRATTLVIMGAPLAVMFLGLSIAGRATCTSAPTSAAPRP